MEQGMLAGQDAGETLMKTLCVRVSHFCGTLFAALFVVSLFAVGAAQADIVDDLLAGKPVSVPGEQAEQAESAAETSAENHVVISEEAAPRSPLDAELSAPVIPNGSSVQVTPESSAPISLVPEPSAIALASLALVYFLVFFRRRYG
jgi:hypothetical protein